MRWGQAPGAEPEGGGGPSIGQAPGSRPRGQHLWNRVQASHTSPTAEEKARGKKPAAYKAERLDVEAARQRGVTRAREGGFWGPSQPEGAGAFCARGKCVS